MHTDDGAVTEQIKVGIEQIQDGCYEGSGGGRPRVPERLPTMLAELEEGLSALRHARDLDRPRAHEVADQARVCRQFVRRLLRVCDVVRSDAPNLVARVRQAGPRIGPVWDEIIEARLARGHLPFPNSEICPVYAGSMEPLRYGNPPELISFAELHLRDYQELDEVGRIVNAWALRLSQLARETAGW